MLNFLRDLFSRQEKVKPICLFYRSLLISVQNRLNRDVTNIFSKQIEAFRLDKHVSFSDENQSIAFPCFEHSELFCRIIIKHTVTDSLLVAGLNLYNGIIDDFTFDKNPQEFYNCDSWQNNDPIIVDIEILFDPLHRENIYIDNGIDNSSLNGNLLRWHNQNMITSEFSSPLNEAQTAILLAKYNTKFPNEYIDIIKQTEGAVLLNLIAIYPLRDINPIDGLSCNGGCEMFAFAEFNGEGVFYVKDGDYSGTIFFSPYDDLEEEEGISLIDCLNTHLKEYYTFNKFSIKEQQFL